MREKEEWEERERKILEKCERESNNRGDERETEVRRKRKKIRNERWERNNCEGDDR